ncbi:MAG: hypothetical protein AAF934_00365 [Bacteroidota bacterium]
MATGDKIISILMENLSVEELEVLLHRKKGETAGKPVAMSEERKWINHYKNEIMKLGYLHPPKS